MKSSIESLEARIAPAAVSVVYTDIDGDKVKVTASEGPLDTTDLTLSAGTSGNLLTLNLKDAAFTGADITISVKKGPKGDGRANVGTIDATGVDLASIKVKGDVSRILAGDTNTQSAAVGTINVLSFGETKLASNFSSLIGPVDQLLVKGNVRGSEIFINGGNIAQEDPAAVVGLLRIGGSLIGEGGVESGNIHAEGGFNTIKIGKDILGGTGDFSGRIESDRGIGSLRVGGSIRGDAGEFSGSIDAQTGLGNTRIGRDLAAGTNHASGAIRVETNIADVRIGRDLIGGPQSESGIIWAKDGSLGKITIGRNVIGGDATGSVNLDKSGAILAHDSIAQVTIRGSLFSGDDTSTGTIKNSGAIIAGKHLGAVKVQGSIIGNATARVLISGVALENEPLSGSDFGIDRVTVGKNVAFANILAGYNRNGVADNADASIGPVKVGGSWAFSNLVAGAQDAGTPGFGVGDTLQMVDNNPNLIARIAGITIGGKITSEAGANFGFVSQQIDFLKIAGKKIALTAGASNDTSKLIPGELNVFVEEV